MNPKLDTPEEKFNKRFERSRESILHLLEIVSDLEYDLNNSADYCDMETLYEASKHAQSIYNLIKKGLLAKGVNLDE